MKLTTVLLIAAFLQTSGKGYTQKITLKQNNISLQKVFAEIRKQTSYQFFYADEVLANQKNVSVDVKQISLDDLLNQVFKNQQLTYTISDRTIIVKRKIVTEEIASPPPPVRITGKVLDENGRPLSGATVTLKSNSKVADRTDPSGNFSIEVNDLSARLVISFVGYTTVEIAVTNGQPKTIRLEVAKSEMDEVVVIGYGTAAKRDVLGAISTLKEEAIQQISPINAFDAMQGRLAGVQIASNGGPGSGADIKIRGISTINAGADPLYVVDGQQLENIDNIDPNDIASIEVLKDGASAAIYGSKSANGVIMITTKKGGKNEKPTIEANYTGSYNYIYNKIPVANSRQRYDFEKLRSGNSVIPPDADSLSMLNAVSVDIQDAILRPAYRNQVNLSIKGGSDNSNYYFNTSYLKEEGVVINSGYDRINTNLNLNFNINKNINAGTRLILSYEMQKGLNEASTFAVLSWRQANLQIIDYDGSLTPEFGGRQNPLAEALVSVRDTRNFKSTFFTFAEIKIIPSLTFKSTLGVNFGLRKQNQLNPSLVQTPGRAQDGFEAQGLSYDLLQENFFNYNKKIGKHSISGLLGVSTQVWKSENSRIQAIAFSSDLIPTFNNVAELNTSNTNTTESNHALSSVFTRLSYDYFKKYLVTATLRRDGSSRFGSEKRWGNFPSVSLGWIASKEDFLRDVMVPLRINELKFRGGYAITGNERIDDFESQQLYNPGYFYNGVNGLAPSQIANPFLSWESTEQVNYGVDLQLFNGRVRASVDLYTKNTKDLLYDVPVPEELGFSSIKSNIGSIQNKGVEVELFATPLVRKGFSWSTSVNVAFNKNTVTALADEDGFESGGYKIDVNQPLGNMYGYRNLGIYAYNESNAYTENGQLLNPVFVNGVFTNYTFDGKPYTGTIKKMKVGAATPGGGDIIYQDINGDFLIDAQNDRTVIGNGLPKTTGGFYNEFKYKSLSLSFLFNFSFGNQIYRQYDDYRNSGTNSVFTPSPEFIDQAWKFPGDITRYPSLQSSRTQNRIGNESQFVSDGDYIRFQNIRLNYNLPRHLFKEKSVISGVTMNLSVNNLFTLTNYNGYNPDFGARGNNLQPGWDQLRYPNKTTIIYGVRVQF